MCSEIVQLNVHINEGGIWRRKERKGVEGCASLTEEVYVCGGMSMNFGICAWQNVSSLVASAYDGDVHLFI